MSTEVSNPRFSNTRKVQLPTINLTETDAEAIGHALGQDKPADVVACKPWLEQAIEKELDAAVKEFRRSVDGKAAQTASQSK